MQIITRLEDSSLLASTPVVMGLGTFDGVHIGHQKIISRVAELAKSSGSYSVIFTFSNHPLSVVNPRRQPRQIMTQADKISIIAKLGIDVLVSIPFNKELLAISPQDFIYLLQTKFLLKQIVVGPNYSFGHKGAGSPSLLANVGKRAGFAVDIMEALYLEETMVSSTVIRKLISKGEMEQAASFLGRPFKLAETVIDGDHRGRTMGFPTANLQFPATLLMPADGVYVVYATVGLQQYKAVANVGNNPTFTDQTHRLEVHFLNFSGDLYGQKITVDFLKRLRAQRTFSGKEELAAQICHDVQSAEAYFAAKENL